MGYCQAGLITACDSQKFDMKGYGVCERLPKDGTSKEMYIQGHPGKSWRGWGFGPGAGA